MEWSDEMVLEFINNYEAEPIIWDPKNVNHKKKHLVADAWRRLKSNLSYENSSSVEELKKKRDSLMAYYRIHLNKIKNSKKSGMGTEKLYKTNWFAFSAMHSFLGPIYECSATINTKEPIEKSDTADVVSSSKKRRQQDMPDLLYARKQLDDAYSIIKERATLNKPESVHECDLYAQLLAEKLKKIEEERRIILMHHIDNLVFQEIMSAKTQKRAASTASSYSSPPESNYDMVLSSPKSPFILPSSPIHTVQSTQSAASSSDCEMLFSQSQQSSFQLVHPSPSLPNTSISAQSQRPLSMSQDDPEKKNIVAQHVIRPRKDLFADSSKIIENNDSEKESS